MDEVAVTVDSAEAIEDYLVTSHSIDGTFDSCARRFEFLHMWRRAPTREATGYAAEVGTAIHEATQEWARKDSRDAGAIMLLRWWPYLMERYRVLESKPIGERTLGNALLLYDRIISHDWWMDWEIVQIEGFGNAIEVPFLIVHKSLGPIMMPDGRWAYIATQGKMDFILRHRRTGQYKVVDLKTTEKSVPAHNAAFRFSGQGGLYAMVLDHALGLDWLYGGLSVTYMVAHFGSAEVEMSVTPFDYELDTEEVQDMIDIKMSRVHEMHAMATTKHWPRRSHGCEFFGTPCGFLDICASRNEKQIKRWFAFEEDRGTIQKHTRHYEPVWTITA